MSKGLEIKTTKSNNKITIIQSQALRELEGFKGSGIFKIVKQKLKTTK